MVRKISALLILLLAIIYPLLSHNGITVKLEKSNAVTNNMIPPSLGNGDESLSEYMTKNVRYPSLLIEIEMEGEIHARFTVDKSGDVQDVEIIKGFDPLADEQVLEAIEDMPKWNPARIVSTNEPADYQVDLIFNFALNDDLKNRLNEIKVEEVALIEKKKIKKAESDSLVEESKKSLLEADPSQNKAPEYEGGQKALDEFLKLNLKYPKSAIKMGVDGRVVFNLTVSEDGTITGINLLKGISSECDEEAYYLIKKMPKWTPGLKDGKPVSMQVMFPVPFVLPR